MPEGGDELGRRIREARWRQGSLVGPREAGALIDASLDHCDVVCDDRTWLVLLTQDCDLVRGEDLEPFVELIAAREIESPEPLRQHARGSRDLHVPFRRGESEGWLACSIHDRFRIRKAALLDLAAPCEAWLTEDGARDVRRWVARRYTRQAFPDAFEKRLGSTSGRVKQLLKSAGGKLISTIYVQTSSQELSEEDYEIDVILAVPAEIYADEDKWSRIEEFEQRFLEVVGSRPGIRFALDDAGNECLRVLSEVDLTLAHARRYKRLDVDYRSSAHEASEPPEGID